MALFDVVWPILGYCIGFFRWIISLFVTIKQIKERKHSEDVLQVVQRNKNSVRSLSATNRSTTRHSEETESRLPRLRVPRIRVRKAKQNCKEILEHLQSGTAAIQGETPQQNTSKGISSNDSGFESRPVSRADTTETEDQSSECCSEEVNQKGAQTFESIKNPQNLKKLPSKSDNLPYFRINDNHSSRIVQNNVEHLGLSKRHNGSRVRYPSERHALSITRHIVRVRSGIKQRARSANIDERRASIRSTFYEDYDQFY